MTAPSMNDGAEIQGAPENYVSFGYLDPLFGRRIMDRLSRQHVRFVARDASRMDVASAGIIDHLSWRDPYPRPARNNRIELFIHSEDQDTARKVIDET
jgi:hypothetical protein